MIILLYLHILFLFDLIEKSKSEVDNNSNKAKVI